MRDKFLPELTANQFRQKLGDESLIPVLRRLRKG